MEQSEAIHSSLPGNSKVWMSLLPVTPLLGVTIRASLQCNGGLWLSMKRITSKIHLRNKANTSKKSGLHTALHSPERLSRTDFQICGQSWIFLTLASFLPGRHSRSDS